MATATTTTVPTSITTTIERPEYPIGVPYKFSLEGVVQRYPGNTTLCNVPPNSSLLPGLWALHDALKSHPTLSKMIHLLPPPTWHMTVFDGVREQECEPGMWPADKLKQPLDECTQGFSKSLRQFGLQLADEGLAPPYRIRLRGFDYVATVGIGLILEGATPDEERRMRRLRDRLADTLGFRAPNHETYEWHMSVCYFLRHIDGEDRTQLNELLRGVLPLVAPEFELGAVEFCTFEDMHGFPRLFYLGETE